jgi:hypothetical protein
VGAGSGSARNGPPGLHHVARCLKKHKQSPPQDWRDNGGSTVGSMGEKKERNVLCL